jgi:hypothetical protein
MKVFRKIPPVVACAASLGAPLHALAVDFTESVAVTSDCFALRANAHLTSNSTEELFGDSGDSRVEVSGTYFS